MIPAEAAGAVGLATGVVTEAVVFPKVLFAPAEINGTVDGEAVVFELVEPDVVEPDPLVVEPDVEEPLVEPDVDDPVPVFVEPFGEPPELGTPVDAAAWIVLVTPFCTTIMFPLSSLVSVI